MALSQENNAMKRDIKAGVLTNPDRRATFVGSTPYYPNRGRGQGYRGSAARGRQGNQGRDQKNHRSWSPDSKKVEGNNNSCPQWRPITPPEDAEYADDAAHADLGRSIHHAPAATPNGNMSTVADTTVSLPSPNVNGNIVADTITDRATTWSNLFKENPEKTFKLQYFEPNPKQRDIVSIPETTISQGSVDWENTIMGYFLDKKLPYSLVHNATSRLWKKHGLHDILATDAGHFFFKFNTSTDCETVLESGPWYIAGKPIILRKWQPGLKFEKEAVKTIPVWCIFHYLPLEL